MDALKDMVEQALSLREQISQLEDQERQLREAIGESLKQLGRHQFSLPTSHGNIKLQRHERVKVEYDDDVLRQRLGLETWLQLCSLDRSKLRHHEQQLPLWLGDNFAVVASLDRRKVKEAVEAGQLDGNQFRGAFTREVQEVVSITRLD